MRALTLLSTAALSASVLIACDGGATKPPFLPEESPTSTTTGETTAVPTPTATPETPTPPSESGGMDGFRAFAPQIEQAVADGDAQFFIDRARISEYTCPGEPAGLGDTRCLEQPGGAVIDGVYLGPWRSEPGLLSLDDLRDNLAAYLDSLSVPTLYAIGDQSSHVSDFFGLQNAYYALVTSSDDPTNTTRLLTFEFSPEEGAWRMAMVINGADEWLSGECTDCYDNWERWEGTP